MNLKKILYRKKEKALIFTIEFEEEEIKKVKIQDEVQATPINGLDLLKWCSCAGAVFQNFDEIDINKKYYLEFVGAMAYKAIEYNENMFKFCVILPIRTGVAEELLGNRVFSCTLDGESVCVYDDQKSKMLNKINYKDVMFVDGSNIKVKNDLSMWLIAQ